jgi:hypothetical protein
MNINEADLYAKQKLFINSLRAKTGMMSRDGRKADRRSRSKENMNLLNHTTMTSQSFLYVKHNQTITSGGGGHVGGGSR